MREPRASRFAFVVLVAMVLIGLAPTEAQGQVKGPNVTEVHFGSETTTAGIFRQVADKSWNRLNPDGSFVGSFSEVGRDEWSVYLVDSTGTANATLNLWLKDVTYTSAGSSTLLGKVLSATSDAVAEPGTIVQAQTRGAVTALAGPVLDVFVHDVGNSFCWRDSYGRGVGVPLSTCGSDSEKSGALCYPPCEAGYTGVGPVCWSNCAAGYTDDGVTCRKDPIIQAKTSQGRTAGAPLVCGPDKEYQAGLCYSTCGEGWSGTATTCYQNCPQGLRDDGLFCGKGSYGRASYPLWDKDLCAKNHADVGGCTQEGLIFYSKCKPGYAIAGLECKTPCPAGWEDIGVSCKKPARDRGVGTVVDSCAAGGERSGALCYPACPAGYAGNGPICWSTCPEGFVDDGATCRKPGDIVGKSSHGRGVGTAMQCAEGLQLSGAICYPPCSEGAAGIGPVCWGSCPSSMPYVCGAGCSVTEQDCSVAIRNMFISGVKLAVDVVEAAVTGGAAEVLSGIVPTDAESAAECAVEVGQRGVDHLMANLSELPASYSQMSAVESAGPRAEVVATLEGLVAEAATTVAPTGGHVLAALLTHYPEPVRDGLITQITLAAEGEQVRPLDIISNIPCIGFGITDFIAQFNYNSCSVYPNITGPQPISDGGGNASFDPSFVAHPEGYENVTLSVGLGITYDTLNVEPSGIQVQAMAKNTVNEAVVREALGASYTPEKAAFILARFESGKVFDLKTAVAEALATLPRAGTAPPQ